jgi:glycosyltransferase involved in cell wall biosynthesis
VPEAHFCGTPTITTDWGAFVETNEQGKTGFRCRTFDDFCKAVEDVKILDSNYIHNRAMNNYSHEAVAPKYDKYFNRLLTLWGKGWYERN